MNCREPEDVTFEPIASCRMAIAALAITALLYQPITVAVPVLESMVFPQVAAQGASKTLVAVFAHGDDEVAAAPILARAGASVLRVASSRGISRDESGPRRAVLPDPAAEVFNRPRSVLHGRLRSIPPIDGVSQDAVLGRNRAKGV
jgi:hypothetical protein